jgi:cell shape-determining protein MreC
VVIILHDLKIVIKQVGQFGEDYTSTVVEVAPVVDVDDIRFLLASKENPAV